MTIKSGTMAAVGRHHAGAVAGASVLFPSNRERERSWNRYEIWKLKDHPPNRF